MKSDEIQNELNYFRTHIMALTERDNGDVLVKDNPQALGYLKRIGREISYAASAKGIKLRKEARLLAISKIVGRAEPISSTKELTTGELRLIYSCVVRGADQEAFYKLLFEFVEEANNANKPS